MSMEQVTVEWIEHPARKAGTKICHWCKPCTREAATAIQVLEASLEEPFSSLESDVAWPGEVVWPKAAVAPWEAEAGSAERGDEAEAFPEPHAEPETLQELTRHRQPDQLEAVPRPASEVHLHRDGRESNRTAFASGGGAAVVPEDTSLAKVPSEGPKTATGRPTDRRPQSANCFPASITDCCVEWMGTFYVVLAISVFVLFVVLAFRLYDGVGLEQLCLAEVFQAGSTVTWGAETNALIARWRLMLFIGTAMLITPWTVLLLARAPALHVQLAAGYAVLVWLMQLALAIAQMERCSLGQRNDWFTYIPKGHWAFALLSPVFFCALVLGHVSALEADTRQHLGACAIRCLLLLEALVGLTAWLIKVDLVSMDWLTTWDSLELTLAWTHIGLHALCSFLALRGLSHARRLALGVAKASSGRPAAEARRLALVLYEQAAGVLAFAATSLLALVSLWVRSGVLRPLPTPFDSDIYATPWVYALVFTGPEILDAVANSFAALALSGAFSGALAAGSRAAAASRARRGHRRRSGERFLSAWRAKKGREPDQDWQDMVEELAGRGFTLEALLQFYEGLGAQYMMHYDAARHTTADVARQAIIPLSSAECSAHASIMMQGQCTRPRKLVTHTWSGLFRDLVAAIVADALEEDEYALIAHLLEHDLRRVEAWLQRRKAHLRTYWVCAFSVNLHSGICASDPSGRRDPVTGDLHPLCPCNCWKAWSRTAPTMRDGRSIACEMNKFGDVVRFLAATNPEFEHVIAVDPEFRLFSRAWCVSELAAAHAAGMVQRLKFKSADSLAEREDILPGLKIEDTETLLPEDKRDILAAIPEHAEFNTRVQELLLQFLLPAWRNVVAVDQNLLARRAARRHSILEVCQLVEGTSFS